MPNWCNNKLVVSGTVENIAEFKKTLGPKGEFKFAQTIPMPRELQGVTVGGNTINGKYCSHWREVTLAPPRVKTRKARKVAIAKYRVQIERNGGSKRVMVPLAKAESDHLTSKYGAIDWYNWAHANWGTKWDTDSDTTMEETWNSDGHAALVSCFDTAWCPPKEWMIAVSEKFPELTFELFYSETGMGFYGTLKAESGELDDDYHEGMFQKDVEWDDDTDQADMMTPEARDFHEEHGFIDMPEEDDAEAEV